MKKLICIALVALVGDYQNLFAQSPPPRLTISSPSPAGRTAFGWSVVTIGNNILVGAPGDTLGTGQANTGAAYLFDGITGDLLKTFSNPNPDGGDRFGAALSIAVVKNPGGEDYVNFIIGAPGEDNAAGAAYIFVSQAGVYLSPIPFRRPDPVTGDEFGASVAASTNFLFIVSAPAAEVGGVPDAGAVYILDFTSGDTLTIPNPAPGDFDRFGTALAMVGKNLIVGTPSDGDATEAEAGAVYIYNSTTGDAVRTIRNPTGLGNVEFGWSVAAFSEGFLVGAPFDDRDGRDAGAAYFFENRSDASPVIFRKLNPNRDELFGYSVAALGNNILIGARGSSDIPIPRDGAAYFFDGHTSNLIQTFTNPTQSSADLFGSSVAAIGNEVVVGAPFAAGAGVVYVFSNTPACQLTPLSPIDGDEICGNGVEVKALLNIAGGQPPYSRTGSVNGVPASFVGDTLVATIPLILGVNDIIFNCNVSDANGDQDSCQNSITISAVPTFHGVVINEILYDPNFNDIVVDTINGLRFGTEKIELKNADTTSVLLDEWALWIRRDTLDTFWAFPRGRRLAPGALLVIHWLGPGIDDKENLFTGLPSDGGNPTDSTDGFWGNNSASVVKMTLAGARNTNNVPFAIALVQRIMPGEFAGFSNPCRSVDFIQIGGSVSTIESIAAQAGLWLSGDFIRFAREGFSYEFIANSSGTDLTQSGDFFHQPQPSIGLNNFFNNPPPNHLLISEICVRPSTAEFLEIFNPSFVDSGDLTNYFLTDNGDFSAPNGAVRRNSYTRIVKGQDSLEVVDDDFVVHFPTGAKIGPRQYQTLAFHADNFRRRYGKKPTYEILSVDPEVKNMRIDKLGAGTIGLKDLNDVVILASWDGISDLVADVDYVAWGSGEAISKFGLAIDGIDADTSRSFYRPKFLFFQIGNILIGPQDPDSLLSPHAMLKSWQRRPDPREFDEQSILGDGITGHLETDEKLGLAFREGLPTPNGKNEGLDLVFNSSLITESLSNGEPNGAVNPGETIALKIRLKNFGDTSTGPLQSILRTAEPLVTIGPDSVSTFANIAPGDSVFSTDTYDLTTANAPLPDTLFFTLIVVQKTSTGMEKSFEMTLASNAPGANVTIALSGDNVSLKMVDIVPTLIVQPSDTMLQISHRLMHTLTSGATADGLLGSIRLIDGKLIDGTLTDLGQQIDYGDLPPTQTRPIVTQPLKVFNFVTKIPFKGGEIPGITFQFSWLEGQGGSGGEVTRDIIFTWLPLTSFKLEGSAKTIAGLGVPGATVKLKNVNTIQTVLTSDVRDSVGAYSTTVSDTGAYEITVTRSGIPMGAIDMDDVTAARDPSRLNVYKRIAANVSGQQSEQVIDDEVNGRDVTEIEDKLNSTNLCLPFSRLGTHWTFIDAHITILPDRFFEAPDHLNVTLKNFHFKQMDFVGILYGDVQGNVNPDPANPNITTGCTLLHNISGKVTYFQLGTVDLDNGNGVRVPNALLTRDGESFATAMTFSTSPDIGEYVLSDIPGGFNYTVTPSKTGDIGSAITSQDVGLLAAYLGPPVMNILNPWQLLAADVDQDSEVDVDDLTKLQNNAGQTGQWRFRKPDKSFPPYTYHLLDSDRTAQDFVAILLGDVNGSWPLLGAADGASLDFAQYPFMKDLALVPGEVFDLPLRIEPSQGILSAMIDLAYDTSKLEFLAIAKSKALEDCPMSHNKLPGRFSAWLTGGHPNISAGEVFLITFRAVGKVGESSLLELKAFSVNDGIPMQATAQVKFVKKVPQHFFLSQNYPNPFNPSTTIEYGLPKDEHVRLQIFNVLGQWVVTVVDKPQEAGYHRIEWNGIDQSGKNLPSGVYIIRLNAGRFSQVRKMALVK